MCRHDLEALFGKVFENAGELAHREEYPRRETPRLEIEGEKILTEEEETFEVCLISVQGLLNEADPSVLHLSDGITAAGCRLAEDLNGLFAITGAKAGLCLVKGDPGGPLGSAELRPELLRLGFLFQLVKAQPTLVEKLGRRARGTRIDSHTLVFFACLPIESA